MVNVITGFVRPTAGEVWMGGRSMLGLPPHRRARLGIARTFQVVRLFKSMTVLENLTVPSERFERGGLIADCLRLPLAGAAERRARSVAEGVLEELGLVDVRDQAAGTLPLGMQRRGGPRRARAGPPPGPPP